MITFFLRTAVACRSNTLIWLVEAVHKLTLVVPIVRQLLQCSQFPLLREDRFTRPISILEVVPICTGRQVHSSELR